MVVCQILAKLPLKCHGAEPFSWMASGLIVACGYGAA